MSNAPDMTYSVAIQNKLGIWITNWHKYYDLNDIDFDKVKDYCIKNGDKAFGYYYGNKSNTLTSSKCRTVLMELV